MKSAKEQSLVAAAFRKLIVETRIEKSMTGDRTVLALSRRFMALPWDTKVFTITDAALDQWAVDVDKDGPTLTLARADSEGRIEIANSGFWKHLTTAFEATHPGLHLTHDESLLERLLHDLSSDHSKIMRRQRADETLRTLHISQREAARRREAQWRANRAAEHQGQYAIWFQ